MPIPRFTPSKVRSPISDPPWLFVSYLLDGLRALALAGLKAKEGIDGQRDVLVNCLGAMVKTREDLARATGLVKDSKSLSGD